MSLIRLVLNSNGTADDFKSECPLAVGGHDAINNFTSYVEGVNGGEAPGASFAFKVGAVQAAGTLTVATGGSTAAQACTICNVTLTGRASNPATNEFVVSATAATQAANMAAAINASASFAGKVTASANLGVVTLTAVVPGVLGNGFQLSAGNLANVTASAFANGSDGTAYSVDLR
jgi:hypothetical protein